MDKQPETTPDKHGHANGHPKIKVKDEVIVTVMETHEESIAETDEEAEKQFAEEMEKYKEDVAQIKAFGQELKDLFHKSQDTFEKQLSYISAGALALSVGFIKDIVHPIKDSTYKWMLLAGWGLLISTLLLNLVSHMVAGKFAKRGARETREFEKLYDPEKINRRANWIEGINWTTIVMLAGGIILIILYITFNAIL